MIREINGNGFRVTAIAHRLSASGIAALGRLPGAG